MTDAEVIDLVFAPGFSTAAQVTAVSGRGVGMDAVRTAVERVGGRVSIHSRPGEGTSVRIMLPFSVMMTTVMSVEAGGQMFGVPLDAVVETMRIPRSSMATVGAARAVVIRDQTIPVLDLGELLGGRAAGHGAGDATIVVAEFAGQRCALDVAALGERLEIVLKPLEGLLVGTPGIIGTTLLGDGRVLLVLDIAELLQ
jgi:two-component system chemotaxis sensor kinase CheA